MTVDTTYRIPETSPWGHIQHTTTVLPGVLYRVETASHGGYLVHPDYASDIPDTDLSEYEYNPTSSRLGKFYEEDCDWAVPWLALLPLTMVHLSQLDKWHRDHFDALTESALNMLHIYNPQLESDLAPFGS